jgi:arylsulfatase A-like enzyme
MERRQFLALAGGALGAQPRKRPNIVLLLTDDQRRDTISALGNPNIRTPHLDSLVRSGVSFRNAYCMGAFAPAVCLPSRMMIQRGCSWFAVQRMKSALPNMAHTFNQSGYITFHLGKRGNEDSAAHKSYQFNHYLEPDDSTERLTGKPSRQLADRVSDFLKARWQRDKPFFLYLADSAPHDPRVAPREYLDMYPAEKMPLPRNYMPFHPIDNGELFIRDEKLAPWPRTEAEVRRHLQEYYAVITYMDEQIGRILACLREIGEFDNTIIVHTADQGIAIGSHGLMGKQNLYQHSMNPALVFAGPGIPKGKSVDGFAYLFDIYPTLCTLAGVTVQERLEGISQAQVVLGKKKSVRDAVFLAYRDLQRAVRRGRWKLIRYPKVNATQLFDLEQDPDEMNDLSGDPAQAGRIRELMALLRAQQKLYGDTAPLEARDPKPAKIGIEFFRT